MTRPRLRNGAPGAAAVVLLACVACGSSATAERQGVPTFAEQVAPIVHAHCGVCHRPRGPAPFQLFTYEDVRSRAERIAQVTEAGLMPPWLPEPGYGEFEGEQRLTAEEITTIRRWAAAGAPEGDPARAPTPSLPSSEWALGPPDLVLEMAEAFTVPANGPDLFRNFVLPMPIERVRYVRAVDLRPGSARAAHHAMMMVDRTPASRALDAEDDRPGFDGMLHSNAEMPLGFLLGWTPGKVPAPEPAGLAWELEPGTDLVLQLHLRPTGREESVRARVGLYFTDEPPQRMPFTLHLVDMTIDLPPGASEYEIRDDYTLPVEVEVLGIYPHAHYLGKRMEVSAALPDGSTRWLLQIDEWDFNWQDAYRYSEPVSLPAGTTVSMRFTYDNTARNPRNPNRPPVRVRYGPQSDDEMGDVWLQVLPADEAARQVLTRDIARKELASRIAFWNWRLASDPADPDALQGLGFVLQALGRTEEAIDHYRGSLAVDPEQAMAHYNLGLALEAEGEVEQAAHHYRETLRLHPAHADALNNLGGILLGQGRVAEAERHWRQALELEPHHALVHNNLGNLLRARGRLDEATTHLERAILLRPRYPEARFNLGLTLLAAGRPREAVPHFRAAVRLDSTNARALASLAWTLATHPDPGVRRPDEAVELAERAEGLSGRTDAMAIQALAAAYASVGRFEEAAAAAERGIRLAEVAGAAETAATLRALLELFRAGQPYRTGGG